MVPPAESMASLPSVAVAVLAQCLAAAQVDLALLVAAAALEVVAEPALVVLVAVCGLRTLVGLTARADPQVL